MEMSLQNIYFIVGVAGFVLAAVCAVAAAVYFVRADIRGVMADLSGKARRDELDGHAEADRARSAKKGVLTQDDTWKGDISHGELVAASGSDAITDEPSSSSGSGSDWSFNDEAAERAGYDEDESETQVSAVGMAIPPSGGVAHAPAHGDPAIGPAAPVPSGARAAGPDAFGFTLVRAVFAVHSDSIIDEQCNEVARGALAGSDAGSAGGAR